MSRIFSSLRQGLVNSQLSVGRVFSRLVQGNILTTVTATGAEASVSTTPSLLLESSSYFLLENGSKLNLG